MTSPSLPEGVSLSEAFRKVSSEMLDDFIRKLKQPLSPMIRQTFIGGYQQSVRDTLAWLVLLEKAYAVEHAQEAAKEKMRLNVPSISAPVPVTPATEKGGGLNG